MPQAATRYQRILRHGSPTASPPTAKRKCSSSPARMMPSTNLKARGVKLALVTNGAAGTQRAKVERFALSDRFDHIQIEGEHGFGKPDERAYLHAMRGARRHRLRDLDDR